MKSPSTLIKLHERQICTLEFMQKAKDRVALYKDHLKLWRDRHQMNWVWNAYKNEQQIIDKIITANRVYTHIKNYYLNLSKQIN